MKQSLAGDVSTGPSRVCITEDTLLRRVPLSLPEPDIPSLFRFLSVGVAPGPRASCIDSVPAGTPGPDTPGLALQHRRCGPPTPGVGYPASPAAPRFVVRPGAASREKR
ncbi:hypothetical protein GCM10025782_09690 [Pedococcus ginsenosidimutans]|uniref:Uncharacterized protein n=1 Tax=Pedococcus ginsenosidimutans TaxID=490570 RepID=A0ABP8XXC5_9MICO